MLKFPTASGRPAAVRPRPGLVAMRLSRQWLPVLLVVLWSAELEAQTCACGHPCDVLIEAQALTGTELVEACLTITAGTGCQVEYPAWVTLRAGERIVLGNGFSVEADTELTLEIDPGLACDPEVDADDDLVDACLDCDDGDDSIYPGATEDCNGKDDDCDWIVDNDVICDDNLFCTEDECSGVGGCVNTLIADHCLIAGQCYPAEGQLPGNPCWACDPAISTSDWAPNDGAACNDGNGCTAGDVCDAGACSGSPIVDAYENNGSLAEAYYLGTAADNDSWPKGSVQATLYPDGDADWYRFSSDDTGSLFTQRPRVKISTIRDDYEICVYYVCDESPTDVTCEAGVYSTYSGMEGCCSNASGSNTKEVKLDPDCGSSIFTPDDGNAYIRVYWVSGAWSCTALYGMDWGDDD